MNRTQRYGACQSPSCCELIGHRRATDEERSKFLSELRNPSLWIQISPSPEVWVSSGGRICLSSCFQHGLQDGYLSLKPHIKGGLFSLREPVCHLWTGLSDRLAPCPRGGDDVTLYTQAEPLRHCLRLFHQHRTWAVMPWGPPDVTHAMPPPVFVCLIIYVYCYIDIRVRWDWVNFYSLITSWTCWLPATWVNNYSSNAYKPVFCKWNVGLMNLLSNSETLEQITERLRFNEGNFSSKLFWEPVNWFVLLFVAKLGPHLYRAGTVSAGFPQSRGQNKGGTGEMSSCLRI